MKDKYTIKRIKTNNENDCWAIALSNALGIEYDKIYKQFKYMINKDNGSVDSKIINGYLKQQGYTIITTKILLRDAIRLYNTNHGILFAMKDTTDQYHITYIKDKTIYESDELTDDMLWWYLNEFELIWVAIKLNGFA